jgi:hypothetical protein
VSGRCIFAYSAVDDAAADHLLPFRTWEIEYHVPLSQAAAIRGQAMNCRNLVYAWL